jgi:TRAP-type C4-dicarboxylate transport system substrate-binding protein
MTTKFGRRRALLASGAAAIAAPALVQSARAQTRVINLTIVSGFPPVAAVVKLLRENYIPGVNARLQRAGEEFRINWNEGFAGTVARPGGELDAIRTGIADLGIVVTPLHVDRLPLYNVAFVTPFVSNDMRLISTVIDQLTDHFAPMRESWTRLNQTFLGASGVADSYHLVSNRPVRSLADLRGLKIGGIGPNLRWLQGTGAVGVQSNLAEFYNAVQTGVADGILIWSEGAVNLRMYQVAPHLLRANLGGSNAYGLTVNNDTWRRLPPAVQQALRSQAADFGQALGSYVMGFNDTAAQLWREGNRTISDLADAERTRWANGMPNIAREWAQDLDRRNLPGTAILEAYMDAMRRAEQPIVRHWDRG